MAACTRAVVSAATPASPLRTRETVFALTPAARATSHSVGRWERSDIDVIRFATLLDW